MASEKIPEHEASCLGSPLPLPALKSTSLRALGQQEAGPQTHCAVSWAPGQGPGPQTLELAGRPRQALSTNCLSQGKQKYTLPLYRAMMAGSEAAQTLAKETFAATAPQLHSNVVHYVQQIVEPLGR